MKKTKRIANNSENETEIKKSKKNPEETKPYITSSIKGFHKTNEEYTLIDDETVTPRGFDRTIRNMRNDRNERNKKNIFTFSENFIDKEEGENKLPVEKNNEIIQNSLHDSDHFMYNFPTENKKQEKYEEEYDNENNFLQRQETLINTRKEVINKENIHDIKTNGTVEYPTRETNVTDTADIANSFNFRLDETPIKYNNSVCQNNEKEYSVKKYRTPGEIDMLEPDESLIGNKCVTITNYVSPPKFVKRIGSFSRFPLSGETDYNPVDYNSFKSMFKNCACVISEQEYLESSSKESNPNLMEGLEDEETDIEHIEQDIDQDIENSRNCIDLIKEKTVNTLNAGEETSEKEEEVNKNVENKGKKKESQQRNRNQLGGNYNMHETPNKFGRSNTAFPTTGNNRSGNSPNRNGRTRLGGNKPLSTSKLLDLLNIEKDDKSKNAKKTLGNNRRSKEDSAKKRKQNDEEEDKYIDFEVKPVFKKDMEIKENRQKDEKGLGKEKGKGIGKGKGKGKKENGQKGENGQNRENKEENVQNVQNVQNKENKEENDEEEEEEEIVEGQTMEELAKKPKNPNPLQYIFESYSDELNILFKKSVCERAHKMYYAYNSIQYMMTRRNFMNEPLYYRIMRTELRKLGGGSAFTEDVLLQLAWLAPCLIVINKGVIAKQIVEKNAHIYTEHNDTKKIEDIEIRESFNEKLNIYKYTQPEKLNICKRIIISWVNIKHNEFLKSLNKNYYLPKFFELRRWHSNFNFDKVIFPAIKLTENKVAARLSFTPHESNTDDFIVENDSPLKTVMLDFETNQRFVKDMDQERTRTPLGRNRRKSVIGSPMAVTNSFSFQSPKKETKNMKNIRESANRKKIISQIKNELDEEEQQILSEKKYWESAKWIAEIIHNDFVVDGIYTVIELTAFSKKVADKYKNTQMFDLNENKIAQIIEVLSTYISDISIKPGIIDKSKVNLSVKSKKNLHYFLEPVAKKADAMAKRYQELKRDKQNRLNDLWIKYEIPFELTENIKKFFLNPGSLTIADL